MTAISKFYLHDATTADTGTLPSSTISATSPTVTASGAGTNRSMNGTIGASQASAAVSTSATKSLQSDWLRRFVSAPIAAQTIAAQSIICDGAIAQSSTYCVAGLCYKAAVWRPSTGALVGRLFDYTTAFYNPTGTTEEASGNGGGMAGSAVTALDGDIIVLEIWVVAYQSKATAYTDTVYYNGTTEDSASNNAAYILFANAITMYSPPSTISGSFTGNAHLVRTGSGSFTGNAHLAAGSGAVGGSFTGNAHLVSSSSTVSGSFTGNAHLAAVPGGSLTGDARLVVGPVTIQRDSFTGTNGTLISAHTPDVGPGWTYSPGSMTGNYLKINASNQCAANSGNTPLYDVTGVTPGADQLDLYVDWVSCSDNYAEVGVYARKHWDGSNWNWYRATLNNYTGQTAGADLYKVTLGGTSGSSLGTIATPGDNSPMRMRLQIQGFSPTHLRMRIWKVGDPEPSTWDIDTTDSSAGFQSALPIGVYATYTAFGDVTVLDNFLAVSRSTTSSSFTGNAHLVLPPSNSFTGDARLAAAAPVTLQQDSFTGTSGVAISARSPDVGPGWTNIASYGATLVINGSNQAAQSGNVPKYTVTGITVGSEQLDLYVSWLSAASFAGRAIVFARLNGSNSYRVVLGNAGATTVAEIQKGSDGYGGVLGSINASFDSPAAYRMRFQVQGFSPTHLRVRVWKIGDPEPATWGIDTTDSDSGYQSALQFGVGAGDSSSYSVVLDDFLATTPHLVRQNSFTGDAHLGGVSGSGSFTGDAHLGRTGSGSFTGDAHLGSGGGAPFPYTGGGYYGAVPLSERVRRLWQGWTQRSGSWVPANAAG